MDEEENVYRKVDEATVTIATLPLEMLVKVFHAVDSVSRKRAERVCRHWHSVLLLTDSLQKQLLLDTIHLAADRLSSARRGCTSASFTMNALFRKSSGAQTMCITGESDIRRPWLGSHLRPGCFVGIHDILSSLKPWLYKKENHAAITTLVLRNMALVGWYVMLLLNGLASVHQRPTCGLQLNCVEFHQVKVQDLEVKFRLGGLRWIAPGDASLVRRISGRVNFAYKCSSPFVQLMALLSTADQPLTPEEAMTYEVICRQLIADGTSVKYVDMVNLSAHFSHGSYS